MWTLALGFLRGNWKQLAIAAVALLAVWRIHADGVNTGYLRGSTEVQKKFDQFKSDMADALSKAQAAVAEVNRKNEALSWEVENDLRPKLDAATANGLSLSQRVREYQNKYVNCARNLSAISSATPGSAATGGSADSGGAVGEATDQYFAACDRDSARLTAWQEWYAKAKANYEAP
jgi:uncharacterized protein YbaP (TraB family)